MSTESLSTSKVSSRTASTKCISIDSETEKSGRASLDSLLGTIDNSVASYAKECADEECHKDNLCQSISNKDFGAILKKERAKSVCCYSTGQCVWGAVCLVIAVASYIFTPLDFMLWEKLNMRPGLPPFEWWSHPPDEVRLRAYVFNITNHHRWLIGLDSKLNVEEIGPIVYLEKLQHYNVTFNVNSTMTYTAKRYPIYLPNENNVDLNSTLIVPNMAVLGMASYLHDAPFLVRSAFRFLVNSHGSEFFVKKTVYEYLWNFTDPVLDTSSNLAPGLVPVTNMGLLARIYADFEDVITVLIGQQWGHERFFQINRFRGQPQIPGYDPQQCPDRIFGSTEGVMYSQHLTKQDVLLYWRKTVCKLMPLHFDAEVTRDSVPVYRYNLSSSVFARVSPPATDCYDTTPSLPPGLSDASKCYYNFPMVISFPHFLTDQPAGDRYEYVTGLHPSQSKHGSYVEVEPLTGTPFRSVARMQSNLRVHSLSAFSGDYEKFSHSIIPLFWAEYNQEGLPDYIRLTIYYMVVILPPLSSAVSGIFLLLGCYFISRQIYIHKLKCDSLSATLPFKSKNVNSLARNKIFTYEKESFLNKLS